MSSIFDLYFSVANAVSKLLYPFAEVVVHNLETDQIEAIYNSFSKRERGDVSSLGSFKEGVKGQSDVIGPYEKTNYDGRKLKSISLVIRDEAKQAVGLLCINIDVSIFDRYQGILTLFLQNHEGSDAQASHLLFKDDLYEKINLFVQNFCMENSLNLESLSRAQKKDLILTLQKEGALTGKNASHYVARVLGVSRATVYNYLKSDAH